MWFRRESVGVFARWRINATRRIFRSHGKPRPTKEADSSSQLRASPAEDRYAVTSLARCLRTIGPLLLLGMRLAAAQPGPPDEAGPTAPSTTNLGVESTPVALVRINELNANVTNGCDLIELRVVAGGSMDGFQLWERTTPILTFSGLVVQVNDYVVVHLDRLDAVCNPSGAGNEVSSPAQFPAFAHSRNYDFAYDWYSDDTGLANTDNVITLYDGALQIVDALLASDDPTGTAAADSEAQAATVAAAGHWQMIGGGVPPGGFVDDSFNAHAVQDLNATGTSVTGNSIQRSNDNDTHTKADWLASNIPTWGANNSGQTNQPDCPPAFGRCNGACVDPDTDPAHCGACGNACGAGETCASGACTCNLDPDCAGVAGADVRCCGGLCTDIVGNALNCGACGLGCGPGGICCGVACRDPLNDADNCGGCGLSCAPGQDCCGGTCANLASDPLHCGACGTACAAGESCCDGTCSVLGTDPGNCGSCGNACTGTEDCCSGTCQDTAADPDHCGACGAACTPGESCCSGGCVDLEASEAQCGACQVPCPNGETCLAGSCRAIAPSALVRIDELNANIELSCDLVELRVVQGGSMDGFELWERTTPIVTFSGLAVQANDRVLVHLGGSGGSCNPAGIVRETRAANELPVASYPTNSDSAFDWYSTHAGLTSTDNVLTLYGGQNQIVDAVLASDDATGTAAAASEAQAAVVAAAGHWEMVGGGVPPGGFIAGDFNAHAVQDLDATGITRAGNSIQRTGDGDTDTKADWTDAASASWGLDQPGQTPFPPDDIDADGVGPGDCNDWNPSVYPAAPQICDGLNNDCADPSYPGVASTNEADDDLDGLSECQGDCADADPTAIQVPTPATGLLVQEAPGGAQILWDDQVPVTGSGTVYDLYSGQVSGLRSSASFAGGFCLAENVAGTTHFVPASASPAAREALYFMVRAQNGCPGGTGSYGTPHRDATSAASTTPCN